MEALDCGFRAARAFGEAVIAVMACTLLSIPIAVNRESPELLMLLPGASSLLVLLILLLARWRRRIRIGEQGIEFCRTSRRVSTRLAWEEVDEIFLFEGDAFEVRGAGKAIRFADTFRNASRARDLCARRLNGIRDHLRNRALTTGKVVFRMPSDSWKAHLAYLGAVMILTTLTGLTLAPLVKGRFLGLPVLIVFFGGSWFWGLRKKASRLGTRVTVQREGFVVRRLDGKERVAWQDFDHPEWNERDGLDLVLKSRRVISLPPSLGNIAMLEELLREGPPPVDSETPTGAENRTMMQNP